MYLTFPDSDRMELNDKEKGTKKLYEFDRIYEPGSTQGF